MKRKWLGLALAAAVVCTGAATRSAADVLAEDSAANYTAGQYLPNGANGGFGFEPWVLWGADPKLADSTRMDDPMVFSQCGDVNSTNGASFRFARRSGDDRAWCNGYRGFSAAMKDGDVLSFRFTCAWCKGGRGLDLFVNGGHTDGDKVANLIHLSGDNDFSVNGTTISTDYAPHAVTEVKITQEADGITLWLKRTSRDQGVTDLEYTTKVETDKKLTGIGLYAGGWEWSGEDIQNTANYAFYVNDLKIEGEPPTDALSLSFPEDAWKVVSATEELAFAVNRTGTEGDLEVTLSSSYPEFASVPESVTIVDGETSAEFTVSVALQGYGNVADISASAEGVTGASYGLKGPQYRISATEKVRPGEEASFWVDWDDNDVRDDTKLTLEIEPEDADFAADGPDEWTWNDRDGGAWVEAHFTANESARMVLKFDGVEMWGADVSVIEPSITIEGPTTIRAGQSATYTVKTVTLDGSMSIRMESNDDTLVSIDPNDYVDVEVPEGEAVFTVTSLGEDLLGSVTLTATDDDELTATLDITIEAAPSYDDYVAYDDSSLYVDGFDFSATGAGTEGFGAWYEHPDKHSAEFGGVILTDSDGGFPAILSDFSEDTLGLYANGSDPDYAVVRPFVNDLQPGQKASLEFVAPQEGGSRYVQFARIWEGVPYNRFEVWASGGKIGVNVQDGEGHELNWSENARRVVVSVMRAADGTDYTLSISGYNEGSEFVDDTYQYSIDSDVGSWGDGIQGIVVGGYDLPSDFLFNRLAIQQVEEPVVARSIGWAAGVWNPDAAGEYGFAISATTDDIGEVLLSVEPSDGALSLSTDRVDLTGVTEAAFTATLSEANEGDSFVIKATPVDTTVEPIEYNVTVSGNYVTISCDAWEYPESAGEIWMALSASLSNYGTYTISTEDMGVLTVPDTSVTITVDSTEQKWFNVNIVGPGKAKIYATAEGETEPATNFEFTITAADPRIDPTTMETVSFADGFSGKVTQAFPEQYKGVRAKVLQWNGEAKAFVEVEELNNELEWPDMKFTPSIDNPVFRLIFEK